MLMKARLTKLFTLLAVLIFGIGNVWGTGTELCSATLNGISSNSNTTGIAQTGCTMKWNSVTYSGSDVITIGTVNFYKFSGSSSYVQLVLTSGSFQAGDELTVTLCSNAGSGKTKSVQYSLHSDSGNKSEAQNVGSASPTDVAYTLVAADIESDGSIKIFRGGNTNIRFGSFSVTRAGGGSTDPVSSVTVAGATTGYATIPVALTATPDETANAYKWFVDGTEQDGETAATFKFTAATPGTYSIVAKARNDNNTSGEYIASSAHTVTISKLCGELIKIVQNGQSDGNVTGILTGTKDVKLSSGTSEYDEKTGRKIGSNDYWLGVKELSKPLRAGDVATIFVTTVSAKLQLFSDKGTTLIGEMDGGVVQGENEIVLNSSATGATAIYLYRTSTAGSDMNPFVHSLSVSRSCTESDDCSISDVTINGESVTPVGKVYSYEVAAASALTEVAVTYAIHPLATGTPTSGFTVAVPTAGDPANTQTITVTAEDGTHSDTYTISVSKATVASDVVTLDALAVTGYTLSPTFDAATLAYTITKAYGTADPTADKVTYTKSEEAQKVEVNYDGTNHKFVITVTAEDNTHTQDYEITINEAEAPKSLSRVLFSNGFDAFIDNTNHTVKAFYLAGTTAPTTTTITAGAGTAGALSEGKIRVTGADDSYVDYIVTLAEVTPNTTTVAEEAAAGEFAGDEAWVKNGLLIYGNAAGYSAGDKWYVNRRLTKSGDAADDQRVIAGWVRSYFFVGNAKKFIMTIGGNRNLDYTIDGGTPVENVNVETLEIALTKGNHMIEIVSHQQSGDCRLSAPKLVELPASHTVTYMPGDGEGALVVDDDAIEVADCPNTFTAPEGKIFNGWKDGDNNDVEVGAAVTTDMALTAQWINHYAVTFNMNGHGDAIDPQDIKHGEKATKPADPIAVGFDFGGWFTDNGTFEAPFDFNTPITAATPLYAKWTADPCPDKKSIVKAVMATNTTATVTGYNSNEYAGGYIVNNLADDASNTNMYDFGEGEVKGFKLKGSNSAIFATLSKGGFEVGDQVVFAVTKNAGDNKLAIYAAKDKDHVLKLVELDVDVAGIYTYRLTQDNIDAIEAAGSDYLSIGTFRGDYNPYIYSVELKGCRSWAIFHTLTFKNFDGTATIAAEPLEEGAYASTVAPTAPKIALKRFIGWAEAVDGTLVDLTSYTITEDKTLYAVYEDIVCPTTGTVYKFEIKDELPSENLPTSTDKDMSSYITATGDGYLTYTATANNKATINSDGTIQMKDASAAYLKVELECALAAGDQIRAHVTNNPMRVQVGTTYDSNKDLILAKNAYEFVAITSAMEGKQVLYITRSSNGNANLADFEIYRPAKFNVSFNMMGHGSAIADLEDVVEGSKIAAPSPSPTDADYSFAGWYKENTLENEWDFDVDVVTDNITLYAKWLDKSDATLKSLKYGETDIVLVVDQYTYDITLPSLTSSVPALTAETNNPNASKVIVDGTFDGEGNATSTVTVTPEAGADKVYTVNFARGIALEQVTVTTSMEWDWSAAGVTAEINNTNTPGLSGNDVVIANVPGVNNDADFNSQALKASGTNAIRTTYFQGKELNIKTDKEGMLIVDFSGTNTKARVLKVYDNTDTEIAAWNYNSDARQVQQVVVPAGNVTLKAFEGTDAQNARIYNLKFFALGYTRSVTEGNLATVCLPNACIARGVEVYELQGKEATYGKIVFDQLGADEVLGAGNAYLLSAKSSEAKFYFTTTPAVSTPDESNAMRGTFEAEGVTFQPGSAKAENVYFVKERALWSAKETGVKIGQYKAWVQMDAVTEPASPNPAPGRRRITLGVNGTNVATGLEDLEVGETPLKVMMNGQLFILRGDKIYDATGRLVK